jgi:citrate synthase
MAERRHRVPGLGHSALKKVDPRAAILYSLAAEEGLWTESVRLSEAIHRAFTARRGKCDIPVNDVGFMASLLVGLGQAPPDRPRPRRGP